MKRSSLVACAYFALLTIFACFISEASSTLWTNPDSVLVLGKCKVINSVASRKAAVPATKAVADKWAAAAKKISDVTAELEALADRKAKGEAVDGQITGKNNALAKLKKDNPNATLQKVSSQKAHQIAVYRASLDGVCDDLKIKEDWTLHGLWPSNAAGKTPVIADTTTISPAVTVQPAELSKNWKDCSGIKGDTAFQNYEWEKHGRNGPAIPGGPNGNGGIDTIYKGTQAKALYQRHALDLLPTARTACDDAVKGGGTVKTAAGAVIAYIRQTTTECVVNVVWNDPAWAVVS